MNQALANRVRNRLITSNAVASHSHVLGALREEGMVLSKESVEELVLTLEREFNGADGSGSDPHHICFSFRDFTGCASTFTE